ncbi:unnamed protein product [Peniophora sp. CBMAI 1063]|nr:unnamed protein product [Peniophora sp. CBMAI 1063]
MYFDNLARASGCIQCVDTVPSCGVCGAGEQCVVTSQSCTACASAACVPTPTSATPVQLLARDTTSTEIVTLTDANGTPTATATMVQSSGRTATPAFAYGIIAGGIVILAILGTFLYCTCYKRRAKGKLPGYQNFGSETTLAGGENDMRQVKSME